MRPETKRWTAEEDNVLRQAALAGNSVTEIASMLGCSVGNSKSQLHKARKRLRELLHEVRHYASHQLPGIASASSI